MNGGIDCDTCFHTIVDDRTCRCPAWCATCASEDCCAETWAAHEERQRIAPKATAAPAPTTVQEDWRALREWLIEARFSAKKVADTAFDHRLQSDSEAKFVAYSRALDFMDERERAAVTHG